ncbi:DEAD/DEAH box helicase [Oerskovia sp. M15]
MTTGTGSGKTEAFLYPILDHVLRAQRAGVTGTKAIILYPMNALANDQAQRLASMITRDKALGGITAALFTGQKGPERTRVTADSLITSRDIVRDTAPDILLTNYKMLDQMLLREPDASIWAQSAHSLQYLVLDEFHTYDGAQGTDVSMLLRRHGLTLKSYWSEDDARLTAEDWQRPLGRITPSRRRRPSVTRVTPARCSPSPARSSARTSRKTPSSPSRGSTSTSGSATPRTSSRATAGSPRPRRPVARRAHHGSRGRRQAVASPGDPHRPLSCTGRCRTGGKMAVAWPTRRGRTPTSRRPTTSCCWISPRLTRSSSASSKRPRTLPT